MSTKADQHKKRKEDLVMRGYSPAVATALAPIESAWERVQIRDAVGTSGITDGKHRAYLVKLLGHKLGELDFPSCPASFTARDASLIHTKARELGDELHARRTAILAAQEANRP